MNLFYIGDKYGRNPSRYYCVKSHLRPFDYDFGTTNLLWSRMLDDVGADVGTGIDVSDIRTVQLSPSESKGKE